MGVFTPLKATPAIPSARTATLWGIMRCWAMAAQIFNNLKKKKPSRTGGWVHNDNNKSIVPLTARQKYAILTFV